MKLKLFMKSKKFQNSWTIVLSALLIIVGLIEFFNPTSTDKTVSIFAYIPYVFGLPIAIIGLLGLASSILLIVAENKKNRNDESSDLEENCILYKIDIKHLTLSKNIIYYILLSLVSIYFIEYLVLGTIQCFIEASEYTKIPEKDQFFVATAWVLMNNGKDYLTGILVTLSISLLGTIIGLVFGLLIAMLRIQKVSDKDNEFIAFIKKIGIGFSKGYIGLFRGTPMMVQAILLHYLVPFAIAKALGIPMSTMDKISTWFVSGLITVSLNTTAYLAEVLRGSIESLDKGQSEAARSIGLSYWQTMLFVILPQALKNSMPSIGNEFVINIKDTSVLNVISVVDIYFVATTVKGQYFRFNEPFFIAACIYLILTFATTRILALIEKKMDVEEKPLTSCN